MITDNSFDSTSNTKNDVIKDIKKQISKINEETTKVINETVMYAEEKQHQDLQKIFLLNKELEGVKEILPLVTIGMSVETLTHELARVEENIRSDVKKIIDQYKVLKIRDNVLNSYTRKIINNTEYLKLALNHLDPMNSRNRMKVTKISIKEFIQKTYISDSLLSQKATSNHINVVLTGEDFLIKSSEGLLRNIFDNLFNNSLHWVNTSVNKDKKIIFEIKANGEVEIEDSGPGIHVDMEHDLFTPFISNRPGGRGLGLYIANEVAISLDAKVGISSVRRDGRLYKFIVKFNKVEVM